MTQTKDYFVKSIFNLYTIAISIVFILIIRHWIVILVLSFGWLLLYFDSRQNQNIYKFSESYFIVYYPRRLYGKRKFQFKYSEISKVYFSRIKGRGLNSEIIVTLVSKEKIKTNYNHRNCMPHRVKEEFVNEFRYRLGRERIKDGRYGDIIKVPK